MNEKLIFISQIPYKVKKEISKMDILLMPYTNKVTTAGDVSNIIVPGVTYGNV